MVWDGGVECAEVRELRVVRSAVLSSEGCGSV